MAEVAKKPFKMTTTHWIALTSVIGLVLGIAVGPAIASVKVIGDIFLRLIMMSVPLMIMGAVIQAVGQISPKELGKLGGKVFIWFFLLTVVAAFFGVVVGLVVQPGVGLPNPGNLTATVKPTNQTISDTFLNLFSNNIIASLSAGNMIQIIIFAMAVGLGLSTYTDRTGDRSMIELVNKANTILLEVIKMVMTKVAPIGVGALLAVASANLGWAVFTLMLKYLGGLALACLLFMIFHIGIVSVWCKVNPIKLAGKLVNMTLVAATTTSSAVTLPTEMQDAEEKLGVSKRIVNLVSPLGMALNSTGQAIYIAIAAIMFIQFFGMDWNMGKLVQIIAVAVLGCLGSMAVPGGGLVVFISMMPYLGLPLEGVALIAGVDWFRGAISTIPNVDSDVLVAMCIAKDEGELDYDVFSGKKIVSATSSGTTSM
jgi:Na+/H+-dicarboxylate symporter